MPLSCPPLRSGYCKYVVDDYLIGCQVQSHRRRVDGSTRAKRGSEMSQRKICASAIEELQRELGGAPERYRDEFNQKEAVRVLFPEIRAMQSKGYSVAEIAQLLSDRGVEVRASSLRTLLSIFRCAAERSRVHRALKARKE